MKTAVSPLSGAHIPLGAHPGNTGGKKGRSGRRPSAVRQACLKAFGARVVHLRAIADGVAMREVTSLTGETTHAWVSCDIPERLRALDMLAKYGMGEQASVEDVRERLRDTITAVRDTLGAQPDLCGALLDRLAAVWR